MLSRRCTLCLVLINWAIVDKAWVKMSLSQEVKLIFFKTMCPPCLVCSTLKNYACCLSFHFFPSERNKEKQRRVCTGTHLITQEVLVQVTVLLATSSGLFMPSSLKDAIRALCLLWLKCRQQAYSVESTAASCTQMVGRVFQWHNRSA